MTRVLLIFCLPLAVSACSMTNSTPTAPGGGNPPAANTVSYTAIGASDAIGYGSSALCVPFVECPDGKGYVQLLAKRLKTDGKNVTLLNLGLPGGVLGPEIQAIGNALGIGVLTNFLDNEVPFIASDATLVTVFAGSNDVNTVASALQAGYGGTDNAAYRQARRQGFGRDLRALMAGVKNRAPSARVVVLNLPNLAGLPYAAGYSLTQKRALQEIAVAFSAEVNALSSEGAIVVDVMCDAAFYQPGSYSSDGFHPNDAGYARMADVVYGPASTGQGTAPRASCSQMSMF